MIEKLKGKEDRLMEQLQRNAQEVEQNTAVVNNAKHTEKEATCDETECADNTNSKQKENSESSVNEGDRCSKADAVATEEVTEHDAGSLQPTVSTLQESVDASFNNKAWNLKPAPEHQQSDGSETSDGSKSMHTYDDAVPSRQGSEASSQSHKAQRHTTAHAQKKHDERSYSDSYTDTNTNGNDYGYSEVTTAEASEGGSKRTITSRKSADGQLQIHTDVERGVDSSHRSQARHRTPLRDALSHDEILMRMTDDHPDVLLDIPNVSVDEITLEVNKLHANVSLDARVANLVQLTAGVDASIDRVKLSIKGVKAQALLVVRLDNVRGIVEKTVSAIVENPLLLETVSGIANNVLRPGGIVSETVHTLGDTIVQTVDRAGNIVEKVVTQPMQPTQPVPGLTERVVERVLERPAGTRGRVEMQPPYTPVQNQTSRPA